MRDSQWKQLPRQLAELDHDYGAHVHLLTDPLAASLVAQLGAPETRQPRVNHLLAWCYHLLLGAALRSAFPVVSGRRETRMADAHPGAAYEGEMLDTSQRVVLAALARAGTLPAHMLFEALCRVLEPSGVRIDHLYMNRATDDAGRVIGTDFSGSKIGGNIDDALLILPDPMGATGGSVVYALEHYRAKHGGLGRKALLLHLIVTPEYLARLQPYADDVEVFALRLDRGTSPDEVLQTRLGSTTEERGLNDIQYIVPGAGGLGEVINNAWV